MTTQAEDAAKWRQFAAMTSANQRALLAEQGLWPGCPDPDPYSQLAAMYAQALDDRDEALTDVADMMTERDEWNQRLTEAEARLAAFESDDLADMIADAIFRDLRLWYHFTDRYAHLGGPGDARRAIAAVAAEAVRRAARAPEETPA